MFELRVTSTWRCNLLTKVVVTLLTAPPGVSPPLEDRTSAQQHDDEHEHAAKEPAGAAPQSRSHLPRFYPQLTPPADGVTKLAEVL
jgi:hypothetical protein